VILPDEVRVEVEDALEEAMGGPTRIVSCRSLSGGCIHNALEVTTSAGPLFLKWNRGWDASGFGAEARGLDALRRATASDGHLTIPAVIGWRDAAGEEPGWLALEYLPPSREPDGYARRLGLGLVGLHRSRAARWGWGEENRIGPLTQRNPGTDAWGDFWRDARLGPQVERAHAAGHLTRGDRALLDQVLKVTPELVRPARDEGPSLLHGDLWSGNVHAGPDGQPVLVDPATYNGHREVDLAMAELFGGFPTRALEIYREAWPLLEGYEEARRPLYQLYYLLAHLNLFGTEYLPAVRRAARDATRSR
jgi:fructosamine-3-kinase